MRKTTISKGSFDDAICIDTPELMSALHCGRASAVKLGELAGAKIVIGRRVLWSKAKIEQYINGIAL
jgi:hypothetical protein